MATEISLTGDSIKVISTLKRFCQEAPKAALDELNSIGLEVRNNIIEAMRNTQKRPAKGEDKKAHRPSMPGHPPAIDSGRLVNSFEILSRKSTVEVGTNVIYAKFLQKGTKPYTISTKKKYGLSDGTNFFGKKVQHPGIAARPFLEAGMKGIDIDKRIKEAYERTLK